MYYPSSSNLRRVNQLRPRPALGVALRLDAEAVVLKFVGASPSRSAGLWLATAGKAR
jgi:hypothetical protein